MKKSLNLAALVIALAAALVWLGAGANRGWTKTKVPVQTLDPVTGIEGITYRARFLPGVDFLAAAGGLAALLAGTALCLRPRPASIKSSLSETK